MNDSYIPVSLIPKPDGGDRPIGVTPLMVALFFKSLTSFVLEWDEAAMDFCEDAIKGSSALRAGLYRRLQDECACALGQETAATVRATFGSTSTPVWPALRASLRAPERPCLLPRPTLEWHLGARGRVPSTRPITAAKHASSGAAGVAAHYPLHASICHPNSTWVA